MSATADDYDFFTVGTGDRSFGGYFSDPDPTMVQPNLMVGGTKNVYKKDRGTLGVRDGLKRYGAIDASLNAVVASYEWQTSFGEIRVIRVLADGQWQVLYNEEWYTLDTFAGKTRFVFTPWWSDQLEQELLVMVNGENTIRSWSGGIQSSTGAINTAGVMASGDIPTILLVASSITDNDMVDAGNNSLSGTNARAAFVLNDNPDVGTTINLTISQTNPFPSGSADIIFTNDVSGAQTGVGLVLIGDSKEETAANLLTFLQNPASDSATQRGVEAGDTRDALAALTYEQVNSLSTGDGANWSEIGFTDGYPGLGSDIVVNGTEYPYTLVAERYLVDISTSVPTGELGFESFYEESGIPAAGFISDFCATITNQVIVGSYNSPVIYFSSDIDFTDFVNSGDWITGDPDQIIIDELPRGVIVVNESAYIPAGSGNWYICKPNTLVPFPFATDGNDRYIVVEVQKKVGAAKTAALAHEFIGAFGENIIYVDQANQLRQFGIFTDVLGTKIPTVSQPVKEELMAEDFTGGALRVIQDRTYLIAPLSGKTYIYEQRDDVDSTGNIVSERIWQPPFEWNISRIAIINNLEYGYSNQSPETYQLWETGQYHDDSPEGIMPYECVLKFGYWQFRDRTKLGDLDKVYLEGYMPQNSPLKCTLLTEYLGSTAIEDIVVSALDDLPTLYTEDGVLVGQNLVGQELIGGATGMVGTPKFRAIAQYQKHQCFEYQLQLYSFAEDAFWELVCIGTNGSQVINKPVYLIKG